MAGGNAAIVKFGVNALIESDMKMKAFKKGVFAKLANAAEMKQSESAIRLSPDGFIEV